MDRYSIYVDEREGERIRGRGRRMVVVEGKGAMSRIRGASVPIYTSVKQEADSSHEDWI